MIKPAQVSDLLRMTIHPEHANFAPLAQYETAAALVRGEITADALWVDDKLALVYGVRDEIFGKRFWMLTTPDVALHYRTIRRIIQKVLDAHPTLFICLWHKSPLLKLAHRLDFKLVTVLEKDVYLLVRSR